MLAEAIARAPGVRAAGPDVALDDAFLQNPYPVYRQWREAGPLHWNDGFFQGAWVLSRHEDVERVLRDPRFSSQRTGGWVKRIEGVDAGYAGRRAHAGLDRFRHLFARAMVFLDAPDHTRLCRVMGAGFHPSLVRGLAPRIEDLVDELLDGLDGPGADAGFDFIETVARPLPSRVIGLMLGVDRADEARFAAWTDDLAAFIGALRPDEAQLCRAQRSLLELVRYFEAVLAQRRGAPTDDLVSLLLRAEAEGLIRADGEVLAQCAMLLFAGHETTRNLLGNGLYTLLRHPAQWAAIQADPDTLPGAMREVLRFDSPVQYTGRRVAADLDWHGHRLRRGDLVIALIGAANRDPARYAEPDRFDISRREGSHLAFGSGPHVCIGAGLSLLGATITLRKVSQRWPTLRLRDTQPRWNTNAALRGLQRLDVVSGHAAG